MSIRPPLTTLLVLLALVILMALPFFFGAGAFTGTDSQAAALAKEINPNAQPWFQPVGLVHSPASENLLFTLQAALGAGLMGYFIGFKQGQRRGRKE